MTKVRVRIGQAEAEVEADPEHIAEAIDLVPLLASKLSAGASREASEASPAVRTGELSSQPQQEQIPIVSIEKGDSLADVISKFFGGPWGRERRKLSDVRVALQSYGLNYPKQSVAVALLRLAKGSKIRRFKADDGEFVYTSSQLPIGMTAQAEPAHEEPFPENT